MQDDSPAPKRRRRAVAAVDKSGAVEAAPPAKSDRVAELEAEVASLRKELAEAHRAIGALRRR